MAHSALTSVAHQLSLLITVVLNYTGSHHISSKIMTTALHEKSGQEDGQATHVSKNPLITLLPMLQSENAIKQYL
jgi:hypothetical protein